MTAREETEELEAALGRTYQAISLALGDLGPSKSESDRKRALEGLRNIQRDIERWEAGQ